MNRSSARGVFFPAMALLFAAALAPAAAYGQVQVAGSGLGETALLTLTNGADEDVSVFRIWLGEGYNFVSFKTESGWTGEKNSLGVIIFTSGEPVGPGGSAKFGVKTDRPVPVIGWKALDGANAAIGDGAVVPNPQASPPADSSPGGTDPAETPAPEPEPAPSMTAGSAFRIVPETPNVGSPIRVTGDGFGRSMPFDFYIDTQKIGSFVTDEGGRFVTTMSIPAGQAVGRVDLRIVDADGQEKKISQRITEAKVRIEAAPAPVDVPLTIMGIPETIHRGDTLVISGTGTPDGAITGEVNTPDGEIISSRTAEIDGSGNWSMEPIVVPVDTPFGRYSATITDGREDKTVFWNVEIGESIIIAPASLKFEHGDTIRFAGTATPGIPIEFILEDPLGNEIHSDIFQVNDTGDVRFEFATDQSIPEGTYSMVATQGGEKAVVHVGLGQLPIIPVGLTLDKFNYRIGDTAKITLSGKPSEIVDIIVIDDKNNEVGEAASVMLRPDGSNTHEIRISGFTSGLYTVVASRGSAQTVEIFAVGLSMGGDIKINPTKLEYEIGDPVLVLGEANAHVLVTITMRDPDGNVIKTIDTYSDKDKNIAAAELRIPSDATPGIWTIRAETGPNFSEVEIEVLGTQEDGLSVVVHEAEEVSGLDTINIHVAGAKAAVTVQIIDGNGKDIADGLTPWAPNGGEISQRWIIPKDTGPGTYTIKVTDGTAQAETTFEVR